MKSRIRRHRRRPRRHRRRITRTPRTAAVDVLRRAVLTVCVAAKALRSAILRPPLQVNLYCGFDRGPKRVRSRPKRSVLGRKTTRDVGEHHVEGQHVGGDVRGLLSFFLTCVHHSPSVSFLRSLESQKVTTKLTRGTRLTRTRGRTPRRRTRTFQRRGRTGRRRTLHVLVWRQGRRILDEEGGHVS